MGLPSALPSDVHIDSAAAPAATIRSVELFPFRHALADGGYGCAKFFAPARAGTLVKITSSDGLTGWGEAFGAPELVVPALQIQARELLGTSVHVRENRLLRLISSSYHLTHGGPHIFAASGLDTALWDVFARTLQVPVSALLGGALRDSVDAYASTGYITPSNDFDRYTEELVAAVEDGFQAAKIRIGLNPQEDRRRVRTAREVLGGERLLMVDFNTHGTVPTIRRSLKEIREYDLHWIEEPLPPEDLTGWEQLRREDDVFAGGEALCTRFSFRQPISTRLYDVVQPDLAACGGFSEAAAISAMATAWNLDISPHCWGTGILQAATLQLLAAVPDVPFATGAGQRFIFEFDRGENPFRDGVLEHPIQVVNGQAQIPASEGLGVSVDEEWVRAHAEQPLLLS